MAPVKWGVLLIAKCQCFSSAFQLYNLNYLAHFQAKLILYKFDSPLPFTQLCGCILAHTLHATNTLRFLLLLPQSNKLLPGTFAGLARPIAHSISPLEFVIFPSTFLILNRFNFGIIASSPPSRDSRCSKGGWQQSCAALKLIYSPPPLRAHSSPLLFVCPPSAHYCFFPNLSSLLLSCHHVGRRPSPPQH